MTLSQWDREHVPDILENPQNDWFTAQIMRLIAEADGHHRGLLVRGFPEEVALVEQYLGQERTALPEPCKVLEALEKILNFNARPGYLSDALVDEARAAIRDHQGCDGGCPGGSECPHYQEGHEAQREPAGWGTT